MRPTLSIKCFLQFDPPFGFGAVHFKHCDTHDKYHECSNKLEYACIENTNID
jgi:hypothetical protein